MSNELAITEELQKQCYEVYQIVSREFRLGDSERKINDLLYQEFHTRDITRFWYNVPIVVLVGAERFKSGSVASDYAIKSPSKEIILKEGDVIYIDLHPMDTQTQIWGDWNTMTVYKPSTDYHFEQVRFLEDFRKIQRETVASLKPHMTGSNTVEYVLSQFEQNNITPLFDDRQNIGHSLHSGPKDQAKRIFLDNKNNSKLGGNIFTIEPGGYRPSTLGIGILVARFEEAVYIPEDGNPRILGYQKLLPVVIE